MRLFRDVVVAVMISVALLVGGDAAAHAGGDHHGPPSWLMNCTQLSSPTTHHDGPFFYLDQTVSPMRSPMTGSWGFWYRNCFVAMP